MVSFANRTVRTTAQVPVLVIVNISAWCRKGKASITHRNPKPMRQQIPILIWRLIWIFHRKTTGRKARAKSQKAELACIAVSNLQNFLDFTAHHPEIGWRQAGFSDSSSVQGSRDPKVCALVNIEIRLRRWRLHYLGHLLLWWHTALVLKFLLLRTGDIGICWWIALWAWSKEPMVFHRS